MIVAILDGAGDRLRSGEPREKRPPPPKRCLAVRPSVGAASARVKKRGSCASEESTTVGHTFRDGFHGQFRVNISASK